VLVECCIDFVHDVECRGLVFLDREEECEGGECLFSSAQAADVHELVSSEFDLDAQATIKWFVFVFEIEICLSFGRELSEDVLEVVGDDTQGF